MAKAKKVVKRSVRRVVRQSKQSWLGQKLGWLAAFFGVSIALLTAVTYRSLTSQSPQIMEVGDTVINEWNFDSANEIGKSGWMGYMVPQQKASLSPSKEPGTSPGTSTNQDIPSFVSLTKIGGKIPLIFQLSNGWAKIWAESETPDKSTTLYNLTPGIDLKSIKTDIVVEIVMKGNIKEVIGKGEKPVIKNTARATLYLGGGNFLTRERQKRLDQQGQATYTFVFEKSSLKPNVGKILALTINPTTLDNVYLFQLMVDRITVSVK